MVSPLEDKRAKVIFIYDETTKNWEVRVENCNSERDACDAFAAVVATCHMVEPMLQRSAEAELKGGSYEITAIST